MEPGPKPLPNSVSHNDDNGNPEENTFCLLVLPHLPIHMQPGESEVTVDENIHHHAGAGASHTAGTPSSPFTPALNSSPDADSEMDSGTGSASDDENSDEFDSPQHQGNPMPSCARILFPELDPSFEDNENSMGENAVVVDGVGFAQAQNGAELSPFPAIGVAVGPCLYRLGNDVLDGGLWVPWDVAMQHDLDQQHPWQEEHEREQDDGQETEEGWITGMAR